MCIISIFLCFALVPRTVDFHWYWYRILKFWYRDNTSENSSDPMTLKIVECESGITHLIQVISLLEDSFMNWVPIDRIPTQCSQLPTPWEWDICWSSLHLTKCVHSQHPATSSKISIIILNQICQIQKPYSWLVTVTSQSFYTREQSHTNTPTSAWNLP